MSRFYIIIIRDRSTRKVRRSFSLLKKLLFFDGEERNYSTGSKKSNAYNQRQQQLKAQETAQSPSMPL